MKNLVEILNEAVYDNGLNKATKILNNIINNHIDDIDSVIYDLLDILTNKGKDNIILQSIESWLNDNK